MSTLWVTENAVGRKETNHRCLRCAFSGALVGRPNESSCDVCLAEAEANMRVSMPWLYKKARKQRKAAVKNLPIDNPSR